MEKERKKEALKSRKHKEGLGLDQGGGGRAAGR